MIIQTKALKSVQIYSTIYEKFEKDLKHTCERFSFANEYLRSWFPKLGSHSAFSTRLNRLSEAFKNLATGLITEYSPK